MSAELDRAAAAWDRAARDGQLKPHPTELDTRPRDALYNQPVPVTIKFTIGKGQLHNPYPKS
jgi:hypothetical protein